MVAYQVRYLQPGTGQLKLVRSGFQSILERITQISDVLDEPYNFIPYDHWHCSLHNCLNTEVDAQLALMLTNWSDTHFKLIDITSPYFGV